jgi:hypothetical protein
MAKFKAFPFARPRRGFAFLSPAGGGWEIAEVKSMFRVVSFPSSVLAELKIDERRGLC